MLLLRVDIENSQEQTERTYHGRVQATMLHPVMFVTSSESDFVEVKHLLRPERRPKHGVSELARDLAENQDLRFDAGSQQAIVQSDVLDKRVKGQKSEDSFQEFVWYVGDEALVAC